VKKRNVKENIK